MDKMLSHGWDSAFNLTSAYRLDSDIPRPFGNLQKAIAGARYYHADKVDPVTGTVTKKWFERNGFRAHS